MKIKIIKELYAEMCLGDQVIKGEFSPLSGSATQEVLGGFQFGEDYWKISERFKGVKLLDNGNLLIKYEYQFSESHNNYEVVDFILEPDKVLVVDDDKIGHWNAKERKQETNDVIFKFYLHYEEVEIDKNSLVLQFKEVGSTTCGEGFKNGDEEWEIPVQLGNSTKSRLIIKENIIYKIIDIKGLDITLECKGEYQTDRYPNVNVDKILINQFYFMHTYSSGGYSTRYDYESWHRSMDIKLKIDDAIMFKGERYQ